MKQFKIDGGDSSVSKIIGRGGYNVKQIEKDCACVVDVQGDGDFSVYISIRSYAYTYAFSWSGSTAENTQESYIQIYGKTEADIDEAFHHCERYSRITTEEMDHLPEPLLASLMISQVTWSVLW